MVRSGSVIRCATLARASPLSARMCLARDRLHSIPETWFTQSAFWGEPGCRGERVDRWTNHVSGMDPKSNGDPGAIRTRDPQLRRLFEKSRNLMFLNSYSEILVRSRSAMRCQEAPWGDTTTNALGTESATGPPYSSRSKFGTLFGPSGNRHRLDSHRAQERR